MSQSQDLFNTQSQDTEISDAVQTDMRSGLRSSEIDGDSHLSYSDLSSIDPNSTTMRPGVNDDYGTTERSGQAFDIPQSVIYGTNINISRIMESFRKFILDFKTSIPDENFITDLQYDPNEPLYVQKMKEMALLQRSWVNIDCTHLSEYNKSLCQNLIIYPKEVIPAMDHVVDTLYKDNHGNSIEPIQTRPYNCEQSRNLRNLNPEDLDQLVTVNGLVIRGSGILPEMIKAHFRCSICNNVTKVPCERGRFIVPEFCNHCQAKYTQELRHSQCEFNDKQMIKLQESPEDMPTGETPHTVTLYCHQDLVDSVQPGDRVTVTGIYRSAPQRESVKQRVIKAVFNTYLDVLHFQKCKERLQDGSEMIKLSNERIEEIKTLSGKPDLYERLSTAIAPSIYGNETIKKGLLLMLFGGRKKDTKKIGAGDNMRSNIHVLLCGDPGTSKSQLLQYVFSIAPRSQYTSGKGSSEVGLTAFITRDQETREPTLQSGALALADNGVCCIDEFDKMSDNTRSILHEVMEQQSLSIAKAGVICQLHARTSVLAAANPVGSSWDSKKTIIENIQLPPTLLSRFDLIFLMLDPQDEVYDERLARHILGLYQNNNNTDEISDISSVDSAMLRDYIAYAKEHIHPVLSEEAENYLCEEYVEMRKVGNSAKGQISAYPRQLESLIRLSEAHARMRLSDVVKVEDCLEARRLQREALKQAAVDPLTGLIDINILTTGVSGGIKKRKEEIARAIYTLLEERRVLTFTYQRVLEELRSQSDRMITRELFEDGLNFLKLENKIDWTGKTIRKR